MPAAMIGFLIGGLIGFLLGFFMFALCFSTRISDYEADLYSSMQATFNEEITTLRRQNSYLLECLAVDRQ